MADKIKITRQQAYEYYEAFSHFYPENKNPVDAPHDRWKTRNDFNEEIGKLTGIDIKTGNPKLIKTAQDILESYVSEGAEANMPSKEITEGTEAEKRVAARKESVEKANQSVRNMIDRQQEFQKIQQNKIYAAIKLEKQKISAAQAAEIEQLRTFAKADPKNFEKDLSTKLEQQISPALSNQASPQDIKNLADKIAIETTNGLVNPGIYDKANQKAAIFDAVAKRPGIPEELKVSAENLAIYTDTTKLSRSIINTINPNLSLAAFGNTNYKVTFYNENISGVTHIIDPNQISTGFTNILGGQLQIFQQISSLTQIQAEHFITGLFRNWVDKQITALPEVSTVYNSQAAQLLMEAIGFGPTKAFAETWTGEILLKIPGVPSFFEGLGKSTGIDFFGKATGKIASEAIKDTATEVVVDTGTKAIIETGGEAIAGGGLAAVITAALAPLGPLAPIVGTIAAFIIEAIGVEIVKKGLNKLKDLAQKYGKWVVAGTAALIGFVFGGIGTSILAGLGTYGGIALLTGGTTGLSSAFAGLGGGILAFFDVLWATFLAGLAAPILGFLIGFPVAVAIILFIINAGAYVVPPGIALLNSTNPYISVEKTANPGGSLPSPTTITYTVKITAKKDSLKGIVITPNCIATKKGGTVKCPDEKIPAPPDQINAGTPFTFTFTSDYGPEYQDALVSNDIKVNAISISGGKVEETGSASVCFRKCPLDCYDFTDPSWNQVPSIKSQFISAASKIAGQYSNFSIKVCKAGPIKMVYSINDPPPGNCFKSIYGRNISNSQINFNKCASQQGGQEGVNYIFTHEITHHIQYTNGYWFTLYRDKVPSSDKQICTYGQGDPSEQMAEADALFIANPSSIYTNPCGVTPSSFQSQYPVKYNFVKNYMYAP